MATTTKMKKPEARRHAPPPKRQIDIRDLLVRYGFIAVTVIFFFYFLATIPAFRMSSTMFSSACREMYLARSFVSLSKVR